MASSQLFRTPDAVLYTPGGVFSGPPVGLVDEEAFITAD